MKMELIQPFINAADAVLAETLQCPTRVGDVTMDEEAYRRKGIASMVTIKGDIEGRIIFDIDTPTAAKVASYLAGSPVPESDEVARETVCELANMVIGSAITMLNDEGFRFKINPPVVHLDELGEKSSEDQESLVMCFDTDNGNVFMNIAMRYNRRRRQDSRPG
ncbi:MAG TPA: chemotaxis protein CheX [Candidatus Angelobacter sp.]|jgi:chemotaxis protein CheX|nr:chemotaxis protein CheX [Candidatus Angelobacter sp.]